MFEFINIVVILTCFCPGQDIKMHRGVRLNNRKVLRAPGPRTKYFERFFIVQ